MATPVLQVAIIEPDGVDAPLTLPEDASAEVVLRTELTADGIEELVASAIRVVVLDLRRTCATQIHPLMRLLRLAVSQVRLVVVTDPGDVAAAQMSIASGAVAHLGKGQTPLGLLRAVNAASRGAPCLGETGQRAVRQLRRDQNV